MLRLFFDDHPPCSAAGLPSPARDADRMRLLSLRPVPTRHIMPVSDVLRLFSATVSDTMPHVPVDRGAAPVLRRNTPDVWRLIRHIMSVSDTICLVTTPDDESTCYVYTRHFASYSSVSCGLSAPGRAPVPTAFRAPFLCPSRSMAPRNPTPSAPASPSFFRYRPPFPRPAVPRHSVPRPRTSPAGPISPGPVFPPRTAPAFCLVSRSRFPLLRVPVRGAAKLDATHPYKTCRAVFSPPKSPVPGRPQQKKIDVFRLLQTCCVDTKNLRCKRFSPQTAKTFRHVASIQDAS